MNKILKFFLCTPDERAEMMGFNLKEAEAQLNAESRIKCPRCSSTNFTAYGKNFSAGRAAAGAIVAGPIGLLAGASHKVELICLDCGKRWKK